MVTPFDLHVLSTPPAFNLSQNQTLQLKSCDPSRPWLLPDRAIELKALFPTRSSLVKEPRRTTPRAERRRRVMPPRAKLVKPFFEKNCALPFNMLVFHANLILLFCRPGFLGRRPGQVRLSLAIEKPGGGSGPAGLARPGLKLLFFFDSVRKNDYFSPLFIL